MRCQSGHLDTLQQRELAHVTQSIASIVTHIVLRHFSLPILLPPCQQTQIDENNFREGSSRRLCAGYLLSIFKVTARLHLAVGAKLRMVGPLVHIEHLVYSRALVLLVHLHQSRSTGASFLSLSKVPRHTQQQFTIDSSSSTTNYRYHQ